MAVSSITDFLLLDTIVYEKNTLSEGQDETTKRYWLINSSYSGQK